MAYKIRIPFYAVNLGFVSGGHFLLPLVDLEAVQLNPAVQAVARQYAARLQRKRFDQGKFHALLSEYVEGTFFKDTLTVDFPASRDGIRHPAFSLDFDILINLREDRHWGLVPGLGLEVVGSSEEQIKVLLEESIQLEFTRKNRLNAMQEVITSIWLSMNELERSDIEISFPSPGELDSDKNQSDRKWLLRIAHRIQPTRQQSYGRAAEMKSLVRAFKNPYNRSVLLVGPSGVGKTALAWEFARTAQEAGFEEEIWETTASVLIKELTRETGWQDNLAFLIQELKGKKIILYVRNLMELFEVGQYIGNSVSMADYLRPYLNRNELVLLTECTDEERARIELRSPNYLSLFQTIRLEEPKKDLESIIIQKVSDMAAARSIEVKREAILEVIRLNRRFTPYAGFPGKPIRFLESLLINIDPANSKQSLGRSSIIRQFCDETGMPAFMIDPSIPLNIEQVRRFFYQNIFGQQPAVDSIVDLLASVKTALTRTGKPIASFLFVGPTGVGKTELAKVLAQFMFGSRNRIERFDMSEFSDPYAVLRLTGTGYFTDGLLTSAIRREPFSVLLFDEIEKAHPDFYDLLLQILSEGRLTDSQGKLVNFCSAIIIMTSNIGAGNLQTQRISWNKGTNPAELTDHFLRAAEKHFRPELFNRIDQVVPFTPLGKETVRQVVNREIDLFRQREGIQFRRLHLNIATEVLDYLADKGYHPKYGARQLQRTIQQDLIIPISYALNQTDYDDQLSMDVFLKDEKISLEVTTDDLGLELLLEELEKINLADHASSNRRKISNLQEGHFYIRLLSEMDILERKKKENETRFWDNRKQAAQYTNYLHLVQQVKALETSIEQLEEELGLTCLQYATYRPVISQEIKQWEEDYRQLKRSIYQGLHPKEDQVYIGIYGQRLEPIIRFYSDLLEAKSFSYSGKTIWFRGRYYYQQTAEVLTPSDTTLPKYIEQPFNPAAGIEGVKPAQDGDLLFGIEFKVEGPCAYLLLREEAGIQQWELDRQETRYLIKIGNKELQTPDGIHRMETYKDQRPRRFIKPMWLEDTRFKINQAVSKNGHLAVLLDLLDKQQETNINLAIE